MSKCSVGHVRYLLFIAQVCKCVVEPMTEKFCYYRTGNVHDYWLTDEVCCGLREHKYLQ